MVVCCECGDIMQNMCVCRIDERVFVHELRNRHIKNQPSCAIIKSIKTHVHSFTHTSKTNQINIFYRHSESYIHIALLCVL